MIEANVSSNIDKRESNEVKKIINMKILSGYTIWEGFTFFEDEPQKYEVKVHSEDLKLNFTDKVGKIFIKNYKGENIVRLDYMLVDNKGHIELILIRAPQKGKKYNILSIPIIYNKKIKISFENKKKVKYLGKKCWGFVFRNNVSKIIY